MQNISLSKLVSSRRNPRKVKPEREAHTRLVASLRAHGLLEPLIVRPEGDGMYRVVAGDRRLRALRVVHHGEDAPIPCVVRRVDAEEAEELSVAENFIREPMHPLDEAEAFARMASVDRKGVSAIAVEFGVSDTYVRQRMKLAGLSQAVKDAYRAGDIDTATAAAFAVVPQAKQEQVWAEVGGKPRHAQQVRHLIEEQWIDASHALFPIESLPEGSVTADLFSERVLVERGAFLQAQAAALEGEREKLVKDGWSEVVVAPHGEVQDRLYSMMEPPPELTPEEHDMLATLNLRLEAVEEAASEDEDFPPEHTDLQKQADAIIEQASGRHSEASKCRGTAFLILSPDGQVQRSYRVPRLGKERRAGYASTSVGPETPPPLPTCNDLSDRQRAALHVHEAIAVRHAVLNSERIIRKRLLVLALHEKVRSDAITIRRDANATTLHAETVKDFESPTLQALRNQRQAIDPFSQPFPIEEAEAYQRLASLSEADLDRLIDVLVVDSLSGKGQRETPLIDVLTEELSVSVRGDWTPDAEWLAGYQKVQLANLMETLRGPTHGSAALKRKKSELVEELAALFSQAKEAPDGFEEPGLAQRVNAWMPAVEP